MDDKQQTIYEELTADFPVEAFNIDRSRGFTLVGLRGAYVSERLSNVFGLLGIGWRFSHSPFTRDGKDNKEVITEVALQYRVNENGTWPWVYDNTKEQFVPLVTEEDDRVWSAPVFGVGGNQIGSGGVPISDAQKSAESMALSKAASRIGIGIKAYKGQVTADGNRVVIAGEEEQKDEMTMLIPAILGRMIKLDPEYYDELRSNIKIVNAYHHTTILKPIIAKIKKAELAEFVSKNLAEIVGDKSKKLLGDLSISELSFVNSMIDAIMNNTVTWKEALAVAKSGMAGGWETALVDYKGKEKQNE